MINNVYISCPISISKKYLSDTADKLRYLLKYKGEVNYWKRDNPKSYDPNWIRKCDFVVFILPSEGWKCDIPKLPIGVYRELNTARELGKKIYISYKPSYSAIPLIYEAQFIDDKIQGIPTTGDNVELQQNTSTNPCKEIYLDHLNYISETSLCYDKIEIKKFYSTIFSKKLAEQALPLLI